MYMKICIHKKDTSKMVGNVTMTSQPLHIATNENDCELCKAADSSIPHTFFNVKVRSVNVIVNKQSGWKHVKHVHTGQHLEVHVEQGIRDSTSQMINLIK